MEIRGSALRPPQGMLSASKKAARLARLAVVYALGAAAGGSALSGAARWGLPRVEDSHSIPFRSPLADPRAGPRWRWCSDDRHPRAVLSKSESRVPGQPSSACQRANRTRPVGRPPRFVNCPRPSRDLAGPQVPIATAAKGGRAPRPPRPPPRSIRRGRSVDAFDVAVAGTPPGQMKTSPGAWIQKTPCPPRP